MKTVTRCLALLALSSLALPAQADELDRADVRVIAWTRGVEAPAFRDPGGVCRVFTHDTPEAMRALGAQVKACFDGTLPENDARAAASAVLVAWHRPSVMRVNELFVQTAAQTLQASASGAGPLLRMVSGFYLQRGGRCHVVVSDRREYLPTLGHEFKHCIDGDFHDAQGRWRTLAQ